jgi:hypothetical protein
MSRINSSWYNKVRKRKSPERTLVLQILHYLRARGWTAGKVKTTGAFNGKGYIFDPYLLTGLPDIFAFKQEGAWCPVMLGIECKVEKNTQTSNQVAFQKLFHFPPSRIYLVARSLGDIQKIA